MSSFGETIRTLRVEKKLPLRTVAAHLDVDQAILSKIERGLRQARRDQVVKLGHYFNVEVNGLLVAWLSDKVLYDVADEDVALQALQTAEESILYKTLKKKQLNEMIPVIKDFLKNDGRVAKAWIFGSVSRGDSKATSDLDLMVRFKEPNEASLFDYADIAYLLEQKINMKVDIVEEGYIKPFAWKTAKKDLKLIYG